MTRLVIRPRAEADLIRIEEFSFDNFGALVAEEYMGALERALDRLSQLPESGPEYEGIRPPVRSLSVRKHRIFYDYDGEIVSVVRVLHQAMVPEDHL
ncbi:type II toxin-antitoxin system RelE/ParE family toxin [Sphingomonas sp. ID1715]|uniref:type II toxin-antitoxin system RelE/ParE family toxin n=1 Tax=Sphingomonas sp. ID1715 TaxID=1656898 RepID=UPI001489B31A|nr:type II toxin-antitoxin system RelE/ParE family toxin [Sphingomonas sp. ID1715]NNM75330.1 type II toxin-antitoxin system RelE/ParE family toxin [Sphingomonas sp. ID1715]